MLTQICAIHLFDAKLSLKLFFLPMFAILLNAKFHYRKLKPAVPSFNSPICSTIFAKLHSFSWQDFLFPVVLLSDETAIRAGIWMPSVTGLTYRGIISLAGVVAVGHCRSSVALISGSTWGEWNSSTRNTWQHQHSCLLSALLGRFKSRFGSCGCPERLCCLHSLWVFKAQLDKVLINLIWSQR